MSSTRVFIQLNTGTVTGNEEVRLGLSKIQLIFEMDMRNRMEDWINEYFPQLTSHLKNTIIDTMIVIYDQIKVMGSNVEYAQFIEEMVGANWTNPSTREQPFTNLRLFCLEQIGRIYVDLAQQLGYDFRMGGM